MHQTNKTQKKNTEVVRSLKARHMSMIAIGGCIGTGLFMASGQVIHNAGPGGALLSYILIGIMVYFLMTSLGEMATYLPVSGSTSIYAARYVHQSLGYALGWNVWLSWVITAAIDLSVAALVLSYWDVTHFFPQWAWALIFFSLIVFLNTLSVKAYGESEFWFALIKVITVIIFIFIGVLTIFGILGGEYLGFKNFLHGHAPFLGEGFGSKFITLFGAFLIAGFSFQGTELIGVTAGESENPQKDIPRSIKQVFWRILIFYILTILVIAMIIPYDNPLLLGAEADNIARSPFTIILEKSGIAFAASIMNAVILTSLLSASNSGIYTSVRTLFSMSKEQLALKKFSYTNSKGVPFHSLVITSLSILLIITLGIFYENTIELIITSSGIVGFISWFGIAISHYRFRHAYVNQGKNLSDLVYKAKFFPIGPIITFLFCLVVILCQDTQLILEGKFNWGNFLISYFGIPFFLCFFFYHKIRYNKKYIPIDKVNLSQEE